MCLAGCAWPLRSTPGNPPAIVRAGNEQNGTSVTLHSGQTLLVTLPSTYWSFQGSPDPRVLAPVGAPTTSPGQGNVPGCGAGTVSQEFRAVGAGTAEVSASRTSCGEVMGCTGASGQYELSVTVTTASQ